MADYADLSAMMRERVERQNRLKSGKSAYTFEEDIGLFFKSAWQSLGEMVGDPPTPDVMLWRGVNPGLSFVSELVTPLGVYGAAFKGMKAIKGFDRAVKGFGASFKSPLIGGAATEVARWAPFELGRVGVSALIGGDVGDTAENAAMSLALEGTFGGVWKLVTGAGKVDRKALDMIERKFNSPPQLVGRALLYAKNAGKLGEDVNADMEILRQSQRARMQEAPTVLNYGGQKASPFFVRELENGKGQELNRIYRGSMKETTVQRLAVGPTQGFFKTDNDWKQALLPLQLKDGWEFFGQFPRLFSFTGPETARKFAKRLTVNMDSVGQGWWMAKEKDEGMFVLAARLPGQNTIKAGPWASDDKWLLLKTDAPEFFLGQNAKFAGRMTKEEAWHMADELDRVRKFANEPVIGHTIHMMDNLPKEAMGPLIRTNGSVSQWTSALAGKLGGTLAKESSGFRQGLKDFAAEFFAPAIHQFGRSARARYVHALARSTFDKARSLAEEALLGKFVLSKSENLSKAFLRGTNRDGTGILDAIKLLDDGDMAQLTEALGKQMTAAQMAAQNMAPNVVKLAQKLEPLADDLLRQINAVRKLNDQRQIKALRGHMTLTMTWRGDHRIPIYEGNKLIYVASGRTVKEAQEEAQAIINDALTNGKEWVKGGEFRRGDSFSQGADDLASASRIDLNNQSYVLANAARARYMAGQRGPGGAPQYLQQRQGIGGAIQTKAGFTKDELADIVKDYVDSAYRYVAEGTVRNLLNGHLAALALEDPTLFRSVTARIDDMAGRPGPFSRMVNETVDKAFGSILGKNSASKIVSNINRLFFSLQLGAGNLAFGVLNMMTFIQTGLPEISFALTASKESLARYYTFTPVIHAGRKASGYVGHMNPWKLWRASFKAMGNPDAEMLKLVNRAAGDGTIEPRMIQEFMGSDSRMSVGLREAFSSKEGMYNGVLQLSEWLPKRTERWARGNAFVTGVLVGRELGLVDDALYLFGKEFTDRTMFRYAMEDRSRIFTGALGSAFGLFKNWQMHFTMNLFDYLGEGMNRGNWKPLLWMTASTGAVGGVAAMPFFGAVDQLSKWFTNESVMDHVYSMFGGEYDEISDGIYMGLPAFLPQLIGLPGLSFTGSASAPMADPARDAQMLFSFVYWNRGLALAQAIGGGYEHWQVTGKSPLDSLEVRRNLTKALAPKTIYRLAQQGLDGTLNSFPTGYPLVKDLTLAEGLLYTLGFQPDRIDSYYETMGQLWGKQEAMKGRVQTLGKAYAAAVESGNQEEQWYLLMQATASGVDVSSVIRSANSRLAKGKEDAIARQFSRAEMLAKRETGQIQF